MTGGTALPKEIADQIIDRHRRRAAVHRGADQGRGREWCANGRRRSLHGDRAGGVARDPDHAARLAPGAADRLGGAGAALGRQFSVGEHQRRRRDAAAAARRRDGAARARELIFRRGTPPDAEYTFKHALVQECRLQARCCAAETELHARIATTLEQKFPENRHGRPELISSSLHHSGRVTAAVPY